MKLLVPDPKHQIISVLMKEARYSMDYEHFEDAVIKLQRCLQLEDEPKGKLPILDDLGYCFLKLGWFEEAIKVYTQLLEANPSDNDSRFFLASAYASLKWTGDAIEELRTILSTDPNDVLACHDLGLCYRMRGKGSCRSESSCGNDRDVYFLNSPCSVCEGLINIFRL